MPARDPLFVHQRAILSPVGAGGMQAQQRHALAGLLDIDTMLPPEQVEMHVAAGDRLEARGHVLQAPAGRSLASASLK